MSFMSHWKPTVPNEFERWIDARFPKIKQNVFMCVLPFLLSCLCFQRGRGVSDSTEGPFTQIWGHLGNIIGGHEYIRTLCPGCSPHFRNAAVGRREGEARHRPRLDFMGGGRKKRRQEASQGPGHPWRGGRRAPRVNAECGSRFSLTDDQERCSG